MVATLFSHLIHTDIPMTPIVPIRFAGADTFSLRQLDELNGLSKGTSFRWFKACEAELEEGMDYFHLLADEHATLIDDLKTSGRIYRSTRHLLLLTRSAYECMRARSVR